MSELRKLLLAHYSFSSYMRHPCQALVGTFAVVCLADKRQQESLHRNVELLCKGEQGENVKSFLAFSARDTSAASISIGGVRPPRLLLHTTEYLPL